LDDWFRSKKQNNSRFSYRVFARRAGQRSPSLLHHVIDGKRNLTGPTTDAFCRAMDLNREQADFFTFLVQLDQARNTEERNRAWERISATRRFRAARQVEGEGFRYLSHWYYPAIRELAHRPDFKADPAWIAATLQPAITVPQARKALEALISMGLLIQDEDGDVVPSEASVVTPHEVAALAAFNYHQGMLARAVEALEVVAGDERHYGAVTAAVPMSLIPRLKREIAAFQEKILDLCDAETDDAEAVYQMNLQLFPLSVTPNVETK
jgi:uncharacterized protein (TIGR02147 family)